MKRLFVFLSMLMMLNFAFAIQPAIVIEQHIKEQKLDLAVTELQEVLNEYPYSVQANCYMSEILKFQGKDYSAYQDRCGNFMKDVKDHESKVFWDRITYFLMCLLCFGVVVAGFVIGTISYKKHEKEQQEKLIQKTEEDRVEQERKDFLKELMLCKETLENNLLLISGSNISKLRKNKLQQKCQALLNVLIDGIEIVQEKGDYDVDSLNIYILDVAAFNDDLSAELEIKNEA